MWTEFDTKKKALFKLCNGKKVCLWGYGYSGKFCEHLFQRTNRKIEYIIDDSPTIDCKLDIERSYILKELDKDTHIVLLAFDREEKAVEFLTQLGYEENKGFIFIKEWFYGDAGKIRKLSYYDWLEYLYGLDIVRPRVQNEVKSPSADCLYYSCGIDYSLVDVLDNFELDADDAVFDFGCGKGAALLLFQSAGFGYGGGGRV